MAKPSMKPEFVIEFITEKKMKKFGYNQHRFDYPIFVYEKNGFYYTLDHWIVQNFMIEKTYSLARGEELYPEMFL